METVKDFTRTKIFFACIFTASFLVMFQRNPEVLKHATFWAEDGSVFYSQLYNFGLTSFFYPYAGYLHLAPRLAVLTAFPFGVINAPLAVNFIALLVRTLPALFLFSERFSFVGLPYKFFLWAYYLLAPNIGETLGNTTNIQWHLALWLLMVLTAEPPSSGAWKIHDWLVLILSGLSGPFVIFFAPLILSRNTYRGGGYFRIALLALSAVQLSVVISTAREMKQSASLGWDFVLWSMKMFDSRAVCETFMPSYISTRIPAKIFLKSTSAVIIFFAASASVPAYYFLRGSRRFRICAVFGALVLGSALYRLWLAGHSDGLIYGGGERYFYIPNMLVFACLLYAVKRFLDSKPQHRKQAYTAVAALLFLIAGTSFTLPAWSGNLRYRDSIKELYYPAHTGDIVKIPIAPERWSMTLTKKE